MKKNNAKFVLLMLKKVEDGSLSPHHAAIKLGCTRQYIYKLLKRLKLEGDAFLIHKNIGKERSWKTPKVLENKIIELYQNKYIGFNFRHFLEKLNEVEAINITYKPLYRILSEAGIPSPKAHRKNKKDNLHPLRPRRESFGELLQIDASIHRWFGEAFSKATLHGAIDDATGTVIGLYFDYEETLNGYFHMLRDILTLYGIPEAFYSDNRTIFEFRKISEKYQTIDRDVQVQFKRVCQQLGIDLITTSVSQAKGRVERLWGTLQSRLIAELMLNNITTIDAANKFLPAFTKDFNRRFALPIDYENSLFVEPPTPKEIDYYLSIEFHRIIDNGSSFSFKNVRYQLVDEDGVIVTLPPKTKIRVFQTYKQKIVAFVDENFYETVPAPFIYKPIPKTKKPGRPSWKPGPDHPWRRTIKKF